MKTADEMRKITESQEVKNTISEKKFKLQQEQL